MGRDTVSKSVQIQIVIGDCAEGPQAVVAVDGRQVRAGHALPAGYGFDDGVLDERMLRILCALALRRLEGPGWTSAEELASLAEGCATGAGVAKLLERRLTDEAPRGRVIEFEPRARDNLHGRASVQKGGRSRGPYRLGAGRDGLVIDRDLCWKVLLGQTIPPLDGSCVSPVDEMALARALVWQGRFPDALRRAKRAVAAVARGGLSGRAGRERIWLFGGALDLLSNIEMEIGLRAEGLQAATQARRLFETLGDPPGEAHALQLQAHLLGQGKREDAQAALMRARAALDRFEKATKKSERGVEHAEYVIVVGQRLSYVRDFRGAACALEQARRAYVEGGLGRGVSLAHIRMAQNAVVAGRIAESERHLAGAHALSAELSPAGKALLARVAAQVMVAARRWDEAERWCAEAVQIGEAQGMKHQLRAMQPILSGLAAHR